MHFDLFEDATWKQLTFAFTAGFALLTLIATLGSGFVIFAIKQYYAIKKLQKELRSELATHRETIELIAEASSSPTAELLQPLVKEKEKTE